MFALFTGLIGGILHVLSGPDHLAAIAPLAAEFKKSSYIIGIKWAIGHTTGIIFIGTLLILCKKIIPLSAISFYSERFAGLILIIIGIWGLQKVIFKKIQVYQHTHNNIAHIHFYSAKALHSHTALVIGIIHGLAGSSHFYGVLPALAMSNHSESLLYLAAFGIGTVISMSIFSSLIGELSVKFSCSYKSYKNILAGFSLSALAVGFIWLIH